MVHYDRENAGDDVADLDEENQMILLCDACGSPACANGTLYCEEYKTAGFIKIPYRDYINNQKARYSVKKSPKQIHIDEETMEGIIRAFWRRIHAYRNDYERELPRPLPVEFKASMETALLLLDRLGESK